MEKGKLLRIGACLTLSIASSVLLAQDIRVTVNGDPVAFSNTRPVMQSGRVLVPLRGVLEEIGAYVDWDPVARQVTATKGDMDIELVIGSRSAIVNGRTVYLDVPAQILRGSTMVPLRFIGESLGADVEWEDATRTVVILTEERETTETTERIETGTGNVQITSFTHTAEGWLRTGSNVRFTLVGTPGGTATIIIPGVTDQILMTEQSPGRYVAEWNPIQRGREAVTIDKASVLARLKVGNSERLIQSGANLSIDAQAPTIRKRTPEANATVATARPSISVTLDDGAGSGIDRSTIQIALDGRPVTADATTSEDFVVFRPTQDLTPGKHTVAINVRDAAGNEASDSWSFTVSSPREVVTTFTHTGRGPVRPGDVIRFSMEGQVGSTITLNVGSSIRNLRMNEVQPGVYQADYTVRNVDVFNNDTVVATVVTRDGERFTIESETNVAAIGGASSPLVSPTISSPAANATASDPLVIRGTATPNSRVKIRLEYATTILGGLRVTGALADVVVDTDARGNFATDPISLRTLVQGRDTSYTITATTISEDGTESKPTTRTLRG